MSEKKNIILFANGMRKRMLDETGGMENLAKVFSVFVGVDKICKPWDFNRAFDDKVIDNKQCFEVNDLLGLTKILNENNVKYALLVGFAGALYRKNTKIIRELSKRNIQYGYFENRADLNKIIGKKKNKSISIRTLAGKVLKNIYVGLFRFSVYPPKHLFTSYSKKLLFVNKTTKLISIPHREVYIARNQPEINPGFRYFVYLHQPISQYFDIDVSAKIFELIQQSLIALSQKTGFRPIICLHPNTKEDELDFFKKHFFTEKGKTASYCGNAEFLLGHYSISVNYGYIFRKPIVLLELGHSEYRNARVKEIAETHRLPVISLHGEKLNFFEPVLPSNEKIHSIIGKEFKPGYRYEVVIEEAMQALFQN